MTKITIIILFCLLLVWVMNFILFFNIKDYNLIGDSFGSINALFSGAALIGVIISVNLQGRELALQREELKANNEEMKVQSSIILDQARIGAANMMIESLKIQIDRINNIINDFTFVVGGNQVIGNVAMEYHIDTFALKIKYGDIALNQIGDIYYKDKRIAIYESILDCINVELDFLNNFKGTEGGEIVNLFSGQLNTAIKKYIILKLYKDNLFNCFDGKDLRLLEIVDGPFLVRESEYQRLFSHLNGKITQQGYAPEPASPAR